MQLQKVGAIDRAQARSTSARNVLLTVRMRTDRAHAPPPSEHKCMKV